MLYLLMILATVLQFPISDTINDGTENNQIWYYDQTQNHIGNDNLTALRFETTLSQNTVIAGARLKIAAVDSTIDPPFRVIIKGILSDSTFSQNNLPSLLPKTSEYVMWDIKHDWHGGVDDSPVYYYSPDISNIINEILQHHGNTISLIIKYYDGNYNQLNCYDLSKTVHKMPNELYIYKDLYDTFIGKELVVKVTDHEAVINLCSIKEVDVKVILWHKPAGYIADMIRSTPGEPFNFVLNNLIEDKEYYYQILYKLPSDNIFQISSPKTFYTRKIDNDFNFAIQTDAHILKAYNIPVNYNSINLYKTTICNIETYDPNFLISLGDFANTEFYGGVNAQDIDMAMNRYLLQRSFMSSIPFFLTLGNHEGEQGWYYKDDEFFNLLPVLSIEARTKVIPSFGTYYSFEWGNSLFIFLDPFTHTTKKPQKYEDAWLWTLGKNQYDWLYETLNGSTAKWKFVFIHHLVSGMVQKTYPYFHPYYGRGGIEVAKYAVNQWPSFEWGGEDENGNNIFSLKRPGWSHGPIHDMLCTYGVNIVFHGHDHCFAKQVLDGIIYQECPQPADPSYGTGFMGEGGYIYGDLLGNSGFINVIISEDEITIQYISSSLDPGQNNQVRYEYHVR